MATRRATFAPPLPVRPSARLSSLPLPTSNLRYEQVVKLLLGAYAEVDARDEHDRTPLHYCCETGYTAVLKVFRYRLALLVLKLSL